MDWPFCRRGGCWAFNHYVSFSSSAYSSCAFRARPHARLIRFSCTPTDRELEQEEVIGSGVLWKWGEGLLEGGPVDALDAHVTVRCLGTWSRSSREPSVSSTTRATVCLAREIIGLFLFGLTARNLKRGSFQPCGRSRRRGNFDHVEPLKELSVGLILPSSLLYSTPNG